MREFIHMDCLLAAALLLAGCAPAHKPEYTPEKMEQIHRAAADSRTVAGNKPPSGTCFPGAMYMDTSETIPQIYVCTQADWPWRKEQVIGRKPQ